MENLLLKLLYRKPKIAFQLVKILSGTPRNQMVSSDEEYNLCMCNDISVDRFATEKY